MKLLTQNVTEQLKDVQINLLKTPIYCKIRSKLLLSLVHVIKAFITFQKEDAI